MKIQQASVGGGSRSVMAGTFEKGFLNKWGLTSRYDKEKPCVFFEAFSNIERIIENTSLYKIVFPTTFYDYDKFIRDYRVQHIKNLFLILSREERPQYAKKWKHLEAYIPNNIKVKGFFPEIKDYSRFKPNPLGDKIYYHSTWEGSNSQCMHTIQMIEARVNYEVITTKHKKQSDFYSEAFLKENYYDKCFLNLNFTHGGAMSTTTELGLMGRKTIVGDPRDLFNPTMEYYNFPSFIRVNTPKKTDGGYSSFKDIIDIINKEAEKIGTIQPSMKSHTIGEEWLDTDFWNSSLMDI